MDPNVPGKVIAAFKSDLFTFSIVVSKIGLINTFHF